MPKQPHYSTKSNFFLGKTDMDYSARVAKFHQRLDGAADAAFFPISADLQYLTGVRRGTPNFGAIRHPGDWVEGAWIAPGRDPVVILPRMTAEYSGLENTPGINLRILGDLDDPAALVRDVLSNFDLPAAPRLALADSTRAETVVALQDLYPDAKFSSATTLLNPLRRIKSAEEIHVMRQAGEITERVFAAVAEQLQPGITELEILQEIEFQLKWQGGSGPSFASQIYCSGPNHPLIWGDSNEKWSRELHAPVAVLFDFGAVLDGYCYDFGRTVFFGAPDPETETIFNLIMDSQEAGIAALKVGAVASQVDATARQVITEAGFGEFFRHRLGHSIGLDVHEAPFLIATDNTVLEEGMLFTIEPSIMRSNATSARVEDIVVARPTGGEPLTKRFQDMYIVD
jgi:Xaa-Pro dipeptidase